MLRPVLPVTKAAEALGVSEQTIRDLYHEKRLRGYKIKRKLLIFVDSLAALQAGDTSAPKLAMPAEPRSRRRSAPDHLRHCA